MDEPGQDTQVKPSIRMENTYQLVPPKKFPQTQVKNILKDVLDSYLAEEMYEPELCRQMTKTLTEVRNQIVDRTKLLWRSKAKLNRRKI